MASGVYLHRNLNQKHYTFALIIAPAKVVNLFDSIAPSCIRVGQFLLAKVGQSQVQVHRRPYQGGDGQTGGTYGVGFITSNPLLFRHHRAVPQI
jgi:hypothetical protein